MKLIFLCLIISTIYGNVHAQHNQSGLIEILESNKFVIVNFLKNDLIDEELFTLTFTELAEQIKNDYKEEKGLVSLVQINCELHKILCHEQLRISIFPAVGYFFYGEFLEYRGELEMESLLQFITDKIGAPIKSIPKASNIDITIKYYFNGFYSNGLVNFIRAYDLMKQHCKMELINTKEYRKSSMAALITQRFNQDVDPLYIESSSINTFNLEEVMRFVQSTLNADYKIQGNKLYSYEKIRVNVTFPVNNTIPKVNSTDIRIPNLKEFKLKTIILSEKEFSNLLLSDKNLDNAWTQIRTYHYVKGENYPTYSSPNDEENDDPNYPVNSPQNDYGEENDVVTPPIYLQPPTYSNPNIMKISKDKPSTHSNPKLPVWTVRPSNSRQYIPPSPHPPSMHYNYNYHTNYRGNTNYRSQPPFQTTSYGQYQPGPWNFGWNSAPSQPMNHYHNHNQGNYPGRNGFTYHQHY